MAIGLLFQGLFLLCRQARPLQQELTPGVGGFVDGGGGAEVDADGLTVGCEDEGGVVGLDFVVLVTILVSEQVDECGAFG